MNFSVNCPWGYIKWEALSLELWYPQKKLLTRCTQSYPYILGETLVKGEKNYCQWYARRNLTSTQKASSVWGVWSFHRKFQKKGKDTLWLSLTSQKCVWVQQSTLEPLSHLERPNAQKLALDNFLLKRSKCYTRKTAANFSAHVPKAHFHQI